MRILRVAQEVYPEVLGGGAYHIHAMSRDQAERGHDVTVLTVSDDNSLPRQEHRDGYNIIRVPATFAILENQFSLEVYKILRDISEFDLIHAHSHSYFSTNIAGFIRRFVNDLPLAITNHCLDTQRAPPWLSTVHLKYIGKWTLNSADTVFCYTHQEKERAQNLGIDTDIEVISNGIDHKLFNPEGNKSDRIDDNGLNILFVGRLVDGKRPQDVLSGYASVAPDIRKNANLYFCGEGPLRDQLIEAVREQSLSDVHFLGRVSHDEMPSLYRSADVVVLVSRVEGVPRVVLEALASETPVISSSLPQIKSLIERAGQTVPVESPSDVSAALEELLTNPELRSKLGSEGRRAVEQQYTWDDTVDQTTARLTRLADRYAD